MNTNKVIRTITGILVPINLASFFYTDLIKKVFFTIFYRWFHNINIDGTLDAYR